MHKNFLDENLKILKRIAKKQGNALDELKNKWFLMPEFLKNTTPFALKNDTLFLKTKDNGFFLQFQEKEILKHCKTIVATIEKIKILQ